MKITLLCLSAVLMLGACANGVHGHASGNNYESRAVADIFRMPLPSGR